MANWDADAANALMMFAESNQLGGAVGAFTTLVDNWANNLVGPTNAYFPFGRYQAEVHGDTNQVDRIRFDM